MKRYVRHATTSKKSVGQPNKPGVDGVLEFLGFKFFDDDPDIATMFDPADDSSILVYDAKSGNITRYEGANLDGTGEQFIDAMQDMQDFHSFIAVNNIHVVDVSFDDIIY